MFDYLPKYYFSKWGPKKLNRNMKGRTLKSRQKSKQTHKPKPTFEGNISFPVFI